MEASHRTKGLVRLTMACNERCPFCNVPAEDYPSKPTPEADVEASLQAFVDAGERTLTLSGGEPTLLRTRLIATVERAVALGIEFVELQTNAILLRRDYCQELADAGVTSAFVSLLADNAADHDALAGLDGAFPRCLEGIDNLLAVGISVTLNPVFAARTQAMPPHYVRFVAERFGAIRHISMSAVQPHGRASRGELLPDYAVLGPAIRAARAVAAAHDIELLNPYCGLPLCAGWDDDVAHSVESLDPSTGPGLDNAGNKTFGAPCRRCALRPACGGAWHAYWRLRRGSGLAAPVEATPPWNGSDASQGPTRWGHALGDDATDLVLHWKPSDRSALEAIRAFLLEQSQRPPRERVQVALGVDVSDRSEAQVLTLVQLANAVGVNRIGLVGGHGALAAKLTRLGGVPVEAVP